MNIYFDAGMTGNHIVKSYSHSPYRFVEKCEFIIILFDHVNNSIYCEYIGVCGQAVLEDELHNLIWGSVSQAAQCDKPLATDQLPT